MVDTKSDKKEDDKVMPLVGNRERPEYDEYVIKALGNKVQKGNPKQTESDTD